MRWIVAFVVSAAAAAAPLSSAHAKGGEPADLLKGKIIISDKRIPTSWSSPGSYAAQLKGMNRGTLWYDKKTGKVKIEYGAFFANKLDDVQCNLVIYDITNGAKDRKATTEQFTHRGDRVIINSITLDKEDFEMNKKYRFIMENRGRTLAVGEVIIRGEGPHYSGRVEFSDDETKEKTK